MSPQSMHSNGTTKIEGSPVDHLDSLSPRCSVFLSSIYIRAIALCCFPGLWFVQVEVNLQLIVHGVDVATLWCYEALAKNGRSNTKAAKSRAL